MRPGTRPARRVLAIGPQAQWNCLRSKGWK